MAKRSVRISGAAFEVLKRQNQTISKYAVTAFDAWASRCQIDAVDRARRRSVWVTLRLPDATMERLNAVCAEQAISFSIAVDTAILDGELTYA